MRINTVIRSPVDAAIDIRRKAQDIEMNHRSTPDQQDLKTKSFGIKARGWIPVVCLHILSAIRSSPSTRITT